jgi:DNA-binding NtrC family response regulator
MARKEPLCMFLYCAMAVSRAGSAATNRDLEAAVTISAYLLIKETLDLTHGNRSHAAKLLGMSRPTLHAKIEKYNIGPGSSSREQLA